MKILFELRTAINVDNNKYLSVCVGEERIEQYIKGLNLIINELSKYQNKFDVVLVDNTLINESYLPSKISDIIPDNYFFYIKEKNDYGKYNKGAGDIEIWNDYSEIMIEYDYIFHYEPRLELVNFSFIESFLNNPRNYFCLAGYNQVKTGYFGVNVKEFKEFYESVDLNHMVLNFISIEYIMFDFFKNKNTHFESQNNSYCIWHDAATNDYKCY